MVDFRSSIWWSLSLNLLRRCDGKQLLKQLSYGLTYYINMYM